VAARNIVEGACAVIAGPLAGALAGMSFRSAAAVGGLIAFTVVPVAFLWLHEPRTALYRASALAHSRDELRRLLRSRRLWIIAASLLVASVPQTFPSALWDHQKHILALSDTAIGYLQGAGGAGAVAAAAIYGAVHRHLPLRLFLISGCLASALGSLGYLFYDSIPAAVAIDAANGFLTTLWTLAMMEMSVWVTPRSAAAAGFALLMSAVNAGGQIGDYVFSILVDAHLAGLSAIAVMSGVATALTAALVPLLPAPAFGPGER
jgi:hypothetical protein